MYKYVNAFTNRSGDSLPGYFARLFDADGNPVDLFSDLNGTPISNVSGVANAALSDENGMFRWYVDYGTYDIRFYDSNDIFVSAESGVPFGVDLSEQVGEAEAAAAAAAASATAAENAYNSLGDPTGASIVGKAGGGTVQGAIDSLTASATRTPSGESTFAGTQAGNLTNTAVSSTAFGYDCLNDLTTGNLNSAFGTRALNRVTTGAVNSAFGAETLTALTTGGYNNAFGCKALGNTTTGWRNNAFGQWVLPLNETGEDNCAFGVNTMVQNLSGSTNNAFGNGALTTSVSAINNCAFGTNALYLTTASHNNAFGNGALYTNGAGADNNAFGYQALYSNTTGGPNCAFGQYTLYNNSTGSYNAAFGHRAGYAAAGDEATSVDTYCTFLGPYASRSSTVPTATVLTNSTAVGNDAKVTASNQVALGNASVDELRLGNGTLFLASATDFRVSKTRTPAGTTGAQTIHKPVGSVNFAAGASTLVVTNSLVTTDSCIFVQIASTWDATLFRIAVVAGAGIFTLHANAAATAETRVNFWVVN